MKLETKTSMSKDKFERAKNIACDAARDASEAAAILAARGQVDLALIALNSATAAMVAAQAAEEHNLEEFNKAKKIYHDLFDIAEKQFHDMRKDETLN